MSRLHIGSWELKHISQRCELFALFDFSKKEISWLIFKGTKDSISQKNQILFNISDISTINLFNSVEDGRKIVELIIDLEHPPGPHSFSPLSSSICPLKDVCRVL
jgi:hypothetical protein